MHSCPGIEPKGVKIYHFSSEVILGNFYRQLTIFSGHTKVVKMTDRPTPHPTFLIGNVENSSLKLVIEFVRIFAVFDIILKVNSN